MSPFNDEPIVERIKKRRKAFDERFAPYITFEWPALPAEISFNEYHSDWKYGKYGIAKIRSCLDNRGTYGSMDACKFEDRLLELNGKCCFIVIRLELEERYPQAIFHLEERLTGIYVTMYRKDKANRRGEWNVPDVPVPMHHPDFHEHVENRARWIEAQESGCEHAWKSEKTAFNCVRIQTCTKCGISYQIDSTG